MIGVVIPTRGESDLLQEAVASVSEVPVLVVDDSPKGGVVVEHATVVRSGGVEGFARAANFGLRTMQERGVKRVLLLNDDAVLAPGSLQALNDAWSDNWGFIPLTPPEIKDVGVKLKPIVFNDLIRIAELDGKPVAFMITLPDLNEAMKPLKGSLLPFGWAKLLLWLRAPKVRTMRVPLMGVVKELQSSRMASQLAFMMIEYIRRASITKYGASRGEIGWILDDNQGMRSIAETINSRVNKTYNVYARDLT